MNLKQFDKVNKLVAEVKTLDSEIIELEAKALLIANGEVKIDLQLSIVDLAKKTEKESKVSFDADGSLIHGNSIRVSFDWSSPFAGLICGGSAKVEDTAIKYNQEIKENEALQILGVLLYVKQSKRTELLTRIQKLGVAI